MYLQFYYLTTRMHTKIVSTFPEQNYIKLFKHFCSKNSLQIAIILMIQYSKTCSTDNNNKYQSTISKFIVMIKFKCCITSNTATAVTQQGLKKKYALNFSITAKTEINILQSVTLQLKIHIP